MIMIMNARPPFPLPLYPPPFLLSPTNRNTTSSRNPHLSLLNSNGLLPIHPPWHTHPTPPLLRDLPALNNIKACGMTPPRTIVASDAEAVVVRDLADAVYGVWVG